MLALLTVGGSIQLWQLTAGSALFGVADAFFLPAAGPIVPELVTHDRDLAPADALLGASEQGAMLLGPAVGDVRRGDAAHGRPGRGQPPGAPARDLTLYALSRSAPPAGRGAASAPPAGGGSPGPT